MIILVEYKIFPIPVKGETIPPPKKVRNPKTAEAVPEFCLSRFNAKVVDVGKMIPKKKRNKKKITSTTIMCNSMQRATEAKQLNTRNPQTPICKAFSFDLKRITLRLPSIIPIALHAKQRLYIKEIGRAHV